MDGLGKSVKKDTARHGVSYAAIENVNGKIGKQSFSDGLGSRWKFWRRRRYLIVTMIFFGEMIKTMLRGNLSVALFPMTENYTIANENGTLIEVRDFDWDRKTRGFLLSVFFYGYLATNIPGGVLAIKYGGYKVFGYSIILTSIATVFSPVAARIDIYFLIILRIFEGMCEGVIDPSMELLLSSWISNEERSSVLNIVIVGAIWGHALGVAASGAIGYHCGWEAIFYCTGGVGVLWFVAWIVLVKEHPTMDKKLSDSELMYIQKFSQNPQPIKMKISSIPLWKIMTSFPALACICAHFPTSWNHAAYLTQFPSYLKDVLKLEYKKSGYLSALQFVLDTLIVSAISPVIDILTSRKILSFTVTRKIFICGTLMTMALCGFLIHQATTVPSVMICLVVLSACEGLCHVQILVNILDIAPRYSSLLTGMVSSTNSICGMIAPAVIGYLTLHKTAEEWHFVFYIQSGMCLLGALLYAVFGSGRLQPWAAGRNTAILEEKEEEVI